MLHRRRHDVLLGSMVILKDLLVMNYLSRVSVLVQILLHLPVNESIAKTSNVERS